MHLVISPETCSYRGEGNSGFVISLVKEEKVIRLEKQDAATKHSTCTDEQRQKCENQISMVKNVMKPLLGEILVNCPVLVFLYKDEIKTINSLFSSQRPKFRLHKGVNEVNSYVLMLPDYCTLPPDLKLFNSDGPVISLEIKPKQGFLTKESFLPPEAPSRMGSLLMCRFCMMQHFKLKRKVISYKSSYCPTDLFSGCPIRMQHALKILLQTPRNNLRIFKDQELVYSENKISDLEDILFDFFGDISASYCDVFSKLVIDILLKPLPGKVNEAVKLLPKSHLLKCKNAYPGCTEKDFCHELPVACVLYRILSLQMLDNLFIKDIYHAYLQTQKISNKLPDHIGCYSRSEIPSHLGEICQMRGELDIEYASRKVWEFVIALIAQDCSIMIVLKKYSGSNTDIPSHNVIHDEVGNPYLFSIAIADLDAKPLDKVEKRYKDTPLILQACVSQPV